MPWRRPRAPCHLGTISGLRSQQRPRIAATKIQKDRTAICPVSQPFSSQTFRASQLVRNHELSQLEGSDPRSVKVAGLVRSIRKQKKVAFAHISDGSTLEPIQAILEPDLAKDITNGAYVELSGQWQPSPGKGQAYELQVKEVIEVGETCTEEYPIQKKSQTPDFLRSLPHLRFRTPFYSLLARSRSQLLASVHDFYHTARSSGPAIQVHPPLITSSDCEGAGEVFTISPKDSRPIANGLGEQQQPYFRDSKYLTVSTQLHLEAYAAELGDVWTLSPTFRAEESDTPRHLSEFYMLEAEFRSISNLGQLMSEAENLIKHIVKKLADSPTGKELNQYYSDPKYASSEAELNPNIETRWKQVLIQQWASITYEDAIKHLKHHHADHPGEFVHAPSFATGLQLEHERHLVSYVANNTPLFVTNYPKNIKPFYMLPSGLASDANNTLRAGDTVACFDLLFPYGTAELVGGSLREHRLPNLIQSMREKGLIKQMHASSQDQTSANPSQVEAGACSTPKSPSSSTLPGHLPMPTTTTYPYLRPGESLGSLQWYTDLRRYGSSPHGGFGMGFDRLLAYMAGVSSIRDTVGFPRYFGRADC